MNPATVPGISIASTDTIADVSVTCTFSPCQPLGATTVLVEPDPGAAHAALLALIDAAILRLEVYRADYAEALAADALSLAPHTCTLGAAGWCLLCGADPRAVCRDPLV